MPTVGSNNKHAPVKIAAGLLEGSLRPALALISDSLIQPGTILLQTLLHQSIARSDSIAVVCADVPPSVLLGPGHNNDCRILDCTGAFPSDNQNSIGTAFPPATVADVSDYAALQAFLVGCKPVTSLYIDSLNTIEIFNGGSSVYAVLHQFLHASSRNRIIAVYHSDMPSAPSTSSTIPVATALLSPNFASSCIHLVLHPVERFAHLHHSYGIEEVGQNVGEEPDAKVFDFLASIGRRQWGSPLQNGDTDSQDVVESKWDDIAYDSPDHRDVVLDRLGVHSDDSGSATGRCIIEYRVRGLGRSGTHNDAGKVGRGLEGLRLSRNNGAVRAVPSADVLRLRKRIIGSTPKMQQTQPVETSNFSFDLTDRQRKTRDATPLPYTSAGTGEIMYRPDSADDIDSDPDEDLEF